MSLASDLLRRYPIVDGHNDLAWAMRDLNGYDLDAYPVDVRQDRTQTDLVRLREGGDEGKPVVLSDPESPAGSALRAIAGKLGGRQRGLAGMTLGLTPKNKF